MLLDLAEASGNDGDHQDEDHRGNQDDLRRKPESQLDRQERVEDQPRHAVEESQKWIGHATRGV
jgi:hypothetical protein